MTNAAERAQPNDATESPLDHCFVCMACSGDPSTPLLDRPLRRKHGVGAVLTGAGPLSVGYVLVVPHAHCGDTATAIRLDPAFLGFVQQSLAEYEELFGEYTVWEHGSSALGMRTSGCIAHAHLNVIPKTPLAAPPDARLMSTWSDLARQAAAPYLLLGGSGQYLQVGVDSGVTQHYRRQWASVVGEADLWDYALTGAQELQWTTAVRYGAWEGSPLPGPGHTRRSTQEPTDPTGSC